jgi:hypothetical protein
LLVVVLVVRVTPHLIPVVAAVLAASVLVLACLLLRVLLMPLRLVVVVTERLSLLQTVLIQYLALLLPLAVDMAVHTTALLHM